MSKRTQGYNILGYAEKSQIVRLLLENELTLTEVSSQFQIGESTFRE
jgi:transposase-like protein